MFVKVLSLISLFIIASPISIADDNVEIRSTLSLDHVGNLPTGLTSVEESVRSAAVKVVTRTGHGSGTYVTMNGFHIILTAAHVVNDGERQFLVMGNNERIVGHLVYFDQEIDVAALLISPMTTRRPIRYRAKNQVSEIGTQIVYSGFPSSHSLLTFRGMIAGYEKDSQGEDIILLHSYGWFGCSGSGVYDTDGNFVGVLWGIDVPQRPWPQIVEDIMWVTPASRIDTDELIAGICRSLLTRANVCAD